MWEWESGSTVEEHQEMCGRYKWFGWKSQEENKQAMDYTGNDQENGQAKEVEGCKQQRMKEGPQKMVEQIEKSYREGQKGISWQRIWQDHGISKNGT